MLHRFRRMVAGTTSTAVAAGTLTMGVVGGTVAITSPASADIPDPTPTSTVIRVKTGGDRTGRGAIGPLVGVQLRLYDGANPVPDGWALCTSDADGCTFVVPNTDVPAPAGNGGRVFTVKRATAPSQWFGLNVLGTGGVPTIPNAYEFNTPAMTANSTFTSGTNFMLGSGGYKSSSGFWQTSRENPILPATCGIRVALIMDLSNSIYDAGAQDPMRGAASVFAESLVGTPSEMAVYTFATDAPAAGAMNATLPLTPLSVSANTVVDHVDGLELPAAQDPPNRAAGTTNWDEGLWQVADTIDQYDVAIMLTDGSPTKYGQPAVGPGGTTRFKELEEAIYSSNALKNKNTRVIAFGVGNGVVGGAENLQSISGTGVDSDYFQTEDYEQAGQELRALALGSCQGSISVVKQIVPITAPAGTIEGATTAVEPWTFGATVDAPVSVSPSTNQTEPATGATSFELSFPGGSSEAPVTLVETQQPGYFLQQVDGKNAQCTRLDTGESVEVTNAASGPGFTVTGSKDYPVSCTLYNRQYEVSLEKTWVNAVKGDTASLLVDGVGPANTNITTANGNEGSWTDTQNIAQAAVVPGEQAIIGEQFGAGNKAGYTASEYTCTKAGGGTVTVTNGSFTMPEDNVACSVTNTRNRHDVLLIKEWIDGLKGDTATLTITGGTGSNKTATSTAAGSRGSWIDSQNFASANVASGDPFEVSETLKADAGTYKRNVVCRTGGPGGEILTATNGVYTMPKQQVLCTYTNTLDTGMLQITKVFNAGASGFTGGFDITYDCLGDFDGTVTLAGSPSGQTAPDIKVPAGKCTFAEPKLPTPPADWAFTEPTFDPADKTVTVETGKTAKVTVTNGVRSLRPAVRKPCALNVTTVKPKPTRTGTQVLVQRVSTNGDCALIKPVVVCSPVPAGTAGEKAFCKSTVTKRGKITVRTKGKGDQRVTVVIRSKPKPGNRATWKATNWRKAWVLRQP